MQVLFLIMGAFVGAMTGRDHPLDQTEAELRRAWDFFLSEHRSHLTNPELVLMDHLESEGHPPPGWTWNYVRQWMHRSWDDDVVLKLLPPGTVADKEGNEVQILDPRVQVFSDTEAWEWARREGRRRAGSWFQPPDFDDEGYQVGGVPLPFQIFMHEAPNWRSASLLAPFQFTVLRQPYRHPSPYEHTYELRKAGIRIASENGAFLNLSYRPRTMSEVTPSVAQLVHSALKVGYILAYSPSFPQTFLLIHPVPRLPEHSPDALMPGIRRKRIDIDLREFYDKEAANRFRMGFGLPLELEPVVP